MKCYDGKIDRHKVASCYLISICSIKPMRFNMNSFKDSIDNDFHFIANETLAITVALSLLRAFVISATENDSKLSDENKREIITAFDPGIKLPDESLTNHGVYVENFATELHFAINEGNINILSIAHELYLLEVITKLDCKSKRD